MSKETLDIPSKSYTFCPTGKFLGALERFGRLFTFNDRLPSPTIRQLQKWKREDDVAEARELEIFKKKLPLRRKRFLGQIVAQRHGVIIDSDTDATALERRNSNDLGYVLIMPITPEVVQERTPEEEADFIESLC